MSSFVDFEELKQKVSIEMVLDWLGIKLTGYGSQLRGPCPIHGGTAEREFIVTPSKGLWFCFSGCGGGDSIKLVAKLRKTGQKEAAELIAEHFGTVTVPGSKRNSTVPAGGNSTVPRATQEKRELRPLDHLQAEHEGVQALGVSPETCRHFGAGYASKGIMRGRFAIPIHDAAGALVAYCGRAVTLQSPLYLFPNGFDPGSVIFGAERVEEGYLYLVREPVDVLLAHENGISNVVCFLTEEVSAQQLEMLSGLMDERRCPSLLFFAGTP